MIAIFRISSRIIFILPLCQNHPGVLPRPVPAFAEADKSSDRYVNFKLYENHSEHSFYFDSEKNNYQLYSNVIIPLKEISELKMYKE